MYAIIETGGKQYRVVSGDVLYIEKLPNQEGENVIFDKVLMIGDGETVQVGTPYVTGAQVKAVVEKQGRGKKIVVFKYKPKKNYHKKQGHRQPYTRVRIEAIEA